MSFRLAPSTSPDTQFFWDGLAEHRLLIQRCTSCATLRHPPRPMCPSCNSLEWDTVAASGRGEVHSFVLPRHPAMPVMSGVGNVQVWSITGGATTWPNADRAAASGSVYTGLASSKAAAPVSYTHLTLPTILLV